LVRATPTEMARPCSARTRRRIAPAISAGEPNRWVIPRRRQTLVDGYPLDQRGEVVEHGDRGVAQPLVLAEMAADEDQVRTQLAGAPPGHAAGDAERFGLVRRGKHDTAADRDRLAAQGGVEHLLDRCIEGVEIRMQDGGDCVRHVSL
jgi:hypothetical protein